MRSQESTLSLTKLSPEFILVVHSVLSDVDSISKSEYRALSILKLSGRPQRKTNENFMLNILLSKLLLVLWRT